MTELFYCQNCGHQVSENQKFCDSCGKKLSVTADHSALPSGVSKKNKPSLKVFKIVTGAILAAIVLTFIAGYQTGLPQKMAADRQISLAEEFLAAKDYEKALQIFEKVRTADPKNQRAYVGLAEVYETLGDVDAARDILKAGYGETGLEAMIQQITRLEEKIEKAGPAQITMEEKSKPAAKSPPASVAPEEMEETKKPPVSQKDLQKSVSGYLDNILSWEIPFPNDFAHITQLDKNWVIQRFALDVENVEHFSDASNNVLLEDIEALVKRNINPDIVLEDDGGYSGLKEGTVENGYYKWFGRGGRNFRFIPYIQGVRRQGETYIASVVEVVSVAEDQFWPNGNMRLYLYDPDTKRWEIPVGIQDALEDDMPLHFAVNTETLPVCEYTLKDNGSGGFYLLSKKTLGKQGSEGVDTDESLLKLFRQRHPELADIIGYVTADFDGDNGREMFLSVKNDLFPDEPFPYGDLWYLDGNGVEFGNLQERLGFVTESFTEDSMRIVKCAGKPYLSLRTIYPMGSYVHVLGVVKGVPTLEINDGSAAHAEGKGQYLKTAPIRLPNEEKMEAAGEFVPSMAGYGMPEYYIPDKRTGSLLRIPAEKISKETLLKYEGAEDTLKLIESLLLDTDNDTFGTITSFSQESIIRRGSAAIGINYLCINKLGQTARKYAVCDILQNINGTQELAYPQIYWGAMEIK